jgi:hypothetical protein
MNREELIRKIIEKKEFSQLPKKDVEKAFNKFERRECSDEEKVDLTRDLLRRAFTAFMGRKIMTPKNKDARWFLLRHVSTKERFNFYEEIYSRIFEDFDKKEISVIDLGAGINGLSYYFFKKIGRKIKYVGIEGVKQLVDVVNYFFDKNKINAKVINESLFEIEKIKEIIKKQKKPRVCFLFKTVDSLEMLKRDYTKEFLSEIAPLCDKFVVSFAMRSLFKRHLFEVRRDWAINFIKENFNVLDEFEIGGEKYIIFSNK